MNVHLAPGLEECFLPTPDGGRLFCRRAKAASPRVELVLTHGLGEHCRRYRHVASALADHGIRYWGYDLRGHGQSSGRRGDAESYELFLDDLGRVLDEASRSGLPVFVMGHSLGAQITLTYLLRRKPPVAGVIATSPWLRLAFEPAWWRLALARLALKLCPGATQDTASALERLSRDLEHLAAMEGQELVHHRLSARLFFAFRDAGADLLGAAEEMTVPILLIHGGADEITCAKATRDFFDRIGSEDKKLVIYPDALHETHNDLCRQQVLADITAWLDERV